MEATAYAIKVGRAVEAAWALPPGVRAAFEQQVLEPPETRGPGPPHRVIATVQRCYLGTAFDTAMGTGNIAKYGQAALRPKGK